MRIEITVNLVDRNKPSIDKDAVIPKGFWLDRAHINANGYCSLVFTDEVTK